MDHELPAEQTLGRLVAGRTHAQRSLFLSFVEWATSTLNGGVVCERGLTPEPPREHQQGRQDSNLRHLVLETSALPTELRPSAGRIVALPRMLSQRHALGLLFLALTVGFAFIAGSAGRAGYWVIAAPSAALGIWMLTMSVRLLRRS